MVDLICNTSSIDLVTNMFRVQARCTLPLVLVFGLNNQKIKLVLVLTGFENLLSMSLMSMCVFCTGGYTCLA